jgi:hypothetical protein
MFLGFLYCKSGTGDLKLKTLEIRYEPPKFREYILVSIDSMNSTRGIGLK